MQGRLNALAGWFALEISHGSSEQRGENRVLLVPLLVQSLAPPQRGAFCFQVENAPSDQHYRPMPTVDVHRDPRLDLDYASFRRWEYRPD